MNAFFDIRIQDNRDTVGERYGVDGLDVWTVWML